jgi:hypothetical protein
VNNRRRLRRPESMGNDNSVGKPIEFGRHRATSVIIGDNEPAVRGRALVGESAIISRGQGGRKLEAPSCQRIEPSAGTPVNCQKAAGLAGRRGGHFAPLYRNDVIASSRFRSTAISLAVTSSASVGGIPACLPLPITDLRKSNMHAFWIEDRSCCR